MVAASRASQPAESAQGAPERHPLERFDGNRQRWRAAAAWRLASASASRSPVSVACGCRGPARLSS